MQPTPYAASLRVYEPIEVFPYVNREYWKKLSIDESSYNREQKVSLQKSLVMNFSESNLDEVHLIDVDGKRFCCPWSLLLRFSISYSKLKSSISAALFPFFIENTSKIQLEILSGLFLGKVAHIKTSTWNIPPRWFGLFSPDERIHGKENNSF